MKHTFLKSGFFRTSNKNEKAGNEISLTNWLKRSLKYLGLPYVDPCCGPRHKVPVSYNTNTKQLQIWNSSTNQFETFNELNQSVVSIEGVLYVSHIGAISTEPTIKIDDPFVLNTSSVAIDVTNTATVDQILTGRITSTSAAAVTVTLPTATALAAAIGSPGCRFQFMIDNSAGSNTVTLDLTGTGITTGTSPITGGGTLTVSTANSIGVFELIFTSTTAALIRRVI
jgi:hypothetical protein